VKNNETSHTGNISSQLDDFLGRPTLLKGEDRISYRKLRKAISEAMHPESLLDMIVVQEVVDNIWESRRFQKLATKLVDAERRNALKILMNSIYGYVSEKADDLIESLEGQPYPDGMTEADFLKTVGLSEELVQAKAVLLAAEDFAIIERLSTNRISQRKASLKDYERGKRQAAREERLAAKAKLQQRDRANDNRPKEAAVSPRVKRASW
jgi:hypothetical protein